MTDHTRTPVVHDGHITVLLHQAIDALNVRAGGVYIDGTFGGGGHSRELLSRVDGDATLYGIDTDPAAQSRMETLRGSDIGRGLVPVRANFRNLDSVARTLEIAQVDGILFDLGLSSFQLDEADRGFAFRFDGPLDMRFDPERGESAADIVATRDADELARIIWHFGEDQQSRRIARAIVAARIAEPITTTTRLAGVVEAAVGGRRGKSIHPATKTFQALRIAVNDELTALQDVLEASIDLLAPGGRLVVIAFHSLEDRIVKQTFAREAQTCICPPEQPVCTCDVVPRLVRIGKPIKASERELEDNPRSRSAIMRVAERTTESGESVAGKTR